MTDVVDLITNDHREVERLFDVLKREPSKRALNLPVLATLLVAHSRAEEAEVYPVAATEAKAAGEVEHSQEEHAEAEHLLEQLQAADPNTSQFDRLLKELTDAVKHHVEEEESDVLPAIRKGLASQRLEELGTAFAEARQQHLGDMAGDATKDELYQQARNADLPGRSTMDKQQLKENLQEGS